MNLRTMSDSEFLRYANAQLNDLTSTDIERELLRRMERCQDQAEEVEGFIALVEEYSFTASELRSLIESHPGSMGELVGLLATLNDEDIHDVDQLKNLLDTFNKFRALANDAGDIITRLASQIETAQQED